LKPCKTFTYEIVELMNPNIIINNMLNASNIEDQDGNVEAENDLPAQALCLQMIDRGLEPRIDQIQYFIEHFGTASAKTEQMLSDNFISLIATLAYDDVSTNQDRQREVVVFQLMTISVDSILANYKLKAYPQDQVCLTLALPMSGLCVTIYLL